MVNAAKRMRALSDRIFHVTNGLGAIQMPANAPTRMTRIQLRVPTGTNTDFVFYRGARDFWRGELQRLKYWNPSLKVDVETLREPGPVYMAVEYESSDRHALETLQTDPYPHTQLRLGGGAMYKIAMGASELKQRAKELGIEAPYFAKEDREAAFRGPPVQLIPDVQAHAPKDEITSKAMPAADASSPQTTSPPAQIFTRTLTLPLAGVRHHEIWNWLRSRTGLRAVDNTPFQKDQQREHQKLAQFKEKAQKDRKLVARGLTKKRKEEAELKKARAAAEKLAAEAI